ncbi:MAG: YueI family protein [Lactobacillaceae bacterium]|nr:YueI family protein [Lactobacillaceae bacterium]
MTDNEQMDPHVQAGLYGTPKINPDEQRHYLGTFRERVYAVETIAEMYSGNNLSAWVEVFKQHPTGTLIINGELDRDIIDVYMQLVKKANVDFTLKNDTTFSEDKSAYGAVYAADAAVHEDEIDIAQLASQATRDEATSTTPRQNWLNKLFGK